MNTDKVIKVAYGEVREFNDIAGNLGTVTDDSIDNQLSFIFEELSEAIEAFESSDKAGLLQESCDLFVVVAGLLQKLEAQGYDVAKALGRVNAANLSKFPKVGELFGNPDGFAVTTNTQYGRVVLKDSVGKVRKPSTFVKCSVADLIPNN